MPNYICKNKECEDYGIEKNEPHVQVVFDKLKGKAVDLMQLCPKCKILRDQIRGPGMTTTMLGSDNICKK